MKAQRGFTLTELVIVLIITGVLAAVAIPRFIDQNQFATRGAHDFTVGALRYAQKTAIATRRLTCVTVGTTTLTILFAKTANARACALDAILMNPANGLAFADPANALPNGITFAHSAAFFFDLSGRPVTSGGGHTTIATATVVDITGDTSAITIEPETGLIH